MLEVDYRQRLDHWIDSVDWNIELPAEWPDFFAGNGETGALIADDPRHNQRVGIRTRAILWVEEALPFCSRPRRPIGIYTRDFSKSGAGFLTSLEFYPEEVVRILLPSFWVKVKIARVRRVGKHCYETGARLIQKFSPAERETEHEFGHMRSIADGD